MANDTVFIIMCTFVSLIAMSGGLFFYLQDKERKRRHINWPYGNKQKKKPEAARKRFRFFFVY